MKSISQSLAASTFTILMHPLLLIFILINCSMQLHAAAEEALRIYAPVARKQESPIPFLSEYKAPKRRATFSVDAVEYIPQPLDCPAASLNTEQSQAIAPSRTLKSLMDKQPETASSYADWSWSPESLEAHLAAHHDKQTPADEKPLSLLMTERGNEFYYLLRYTNNTHLYHMTPETKNIPSVKTAIFKPEKKYRPLIEKVAKRPITAALQCLMKVATPPENELSPIGLSVMKELIDKYCHKSVFFNGVYAPTFRLLILEERKQSDGNLALFFPRSSNDNPGEFIQQRFCISPKNINNLPCDGKTSILTDDYVCLFKCLKPRSKTYWTHNIKNPEITLPCKIQWLPFIDACNMMAKNKREVSLNSLEESYDDAHCPPAKVYAYDDYAAYDDADCSAEPSSAATSLYGDGAADNQDILW